MLECICSIKDRMPTNLENFKKKKTGQQGISLGFGTDVFAVARVGLNLKTLIS